MSTNSFDPFLRHRVAAESKPEPAQAQPIVRTAIAPAEAPANETVETGLAGLMRTPTVVKTVEPKPPAKAPAVKPKPTEGKSPVAARTNNPFSQHKVEPSTQSEPERAPAAAPELLYWLQHNWTKPTISLREVQVYGPRAVRDRQSARTYAEALERQGWLVELKPHRRDRRLWKLPPAMATRSA
jgi:hypothetical protein